MKKLLLIAVVAVSVFTVNAQESELMVQIGEKGSYIEHKVAPKQGLYAIGRLYNVNPKFIAAYNKIDLNGGLNIGQLLKIPLTDTNFTQKGNSGTPVYYKTSGNESLQRVSVANKNVALQSLREWNSLANDNVKPGIKLIIGFLQSNELTSVTIKTPEVTKPADDKQVAEIKSILNEEPKVISQPVEKKVLKEEPANTKPETVNPVAVKEEPKKIETQEIKTVNTEGGYFKDDFEKQTKAIPTTKNSTVNAGIFKTTSGLPEAKYYLLIDGVSPGTIVKVTNPGNNKSVYAKVLGEMNGIRQNQGLDVRISNAAASALEINDPEKFVVKVNY